MIRQSLPGIMTLGYVERKKLQKQMMHKSLAGLLVGVFTDITSIDFVGVPTCETESDYDNNGRIEKATLRFATNDSIPIYKDLAFVMKDCNGQSWVLGTREMPRPIVKVGHSTGTPGSDVNIWNFEVTLYSHRALIACETTAKMT